MPKLNQILAIEKNKKTQLHKEISDLHHQTQKVELLTGHHKTYTPREEDGETFPDDTRKVQVLHHEAIKQVCERLTTLMDVTATKDWANCQAKADVIVDAEVFLEQVPVPFLLFLEKELHDLHTFVDKIVDLDPSENWTLDSNSGQYRSEPVKTSKTQKLQKPIVLYDATKEHPAQTQLITQDVIIGHWTTTKFSGAVPRARKKLLLERITVLEDAVKYAREHANSLDVDDKKVGRRVLDYVFKEGT
jgi:hypothetical protein